MNDYANGVVIDQDDNVWVCGETHSINVTNADVFVAKLSPLGELLLALRFGGSDYDVCNALAVDAQNVVWIAGTTVSFGLSYNDVLLAKINSDGSLFGVVRWGGEYGDSASALAIDSQGAIWLAGNTYSFGSADSDVFVAKFASDGGLLKAVRWGGTNYDSANGLAIDAIGSVWVTGQTKSFGASGWDMFLLKVLPNVHMDKALLWGGDDDDYGNKLAVDSQGFVWVVGSTESFGASGLDAFLAQFSSDANLQKVVRWGGSYWDYCYGIAIDAQDAIWALGHVGIDDGAGNVNSDMFLAQFSSSSDLGWAYRWGGRG